MASGFRIILKMLGDFFPGGRVWKGTPKRPKLLGRARNTENERGNEGRQGLNKADSCTRPPHLEKILHRGVACIWRPLLPQFFYGFRDADTCPLQSLWLRKQMYY